MTATLHAAADAVLARVTARTPRVAGVVAAATDRRGALYEGFAGERALGGGVAMTPDTVCALFSATKAVTATAALRLVEDGRLDLDAPAARYAPDIAQLKVIEGFGADGALLLRAPRRAITTRMLLLHTAGLGYDTFNEICAALCRDHGLPRTASGRKAALMGPLLFDPGERWEYGASIDWVGQVVEAITGQRLGAVMAARIFDACGMGATAFTMTPDMRARLARVHARLPDGGLKPLEYELPQSPEVQMGGHGLYGTAPDYLRFIRMWLNDGMGEHGRVLKPETVAMASANGLGALKIRALPAVNPTLTNVAEFFPGMTKSWALSFMVNDADAPTGRAAGSLAWAGLANLYYWIDRRSGVGGVWATQLFPFADATAMQGYLDFETAVYAALKDRAAA